VNSEEIISLLPYSKPFLFVDELTEIDEEGIKGNYTLEPALDFYQGHFKENPITPGVILTEIMAQIGVVCLGIHLSAKTIDSNMQIALTSSQVDFYLPVFPGEKVFVESKKDYFRFSKLKCSVSLFNASKELVCRGTISGMVKSNG
jgi:3-hydroxyacyl-[acyl-carrier-protein] dehydratase